MFTEYPITTTNHIEERGVTKTTKQRRLAIVWVTLGMFMIVAPSGCEPSQTPEIELSGTSGTTQIQGELVPIGAGARVAGPNRCYTDNDCLLFSRDCICKAVSEQQTTQCKPSCVNIIDPCTFQSAVCEKHHCVLKPEKTPPPGTCTVEQDCPQSFDMCFSPGQKLPCGICYNPDPSEVCNDDLMCKQMDPTWICTTSQSLCTCGGEMLCSPGCLNNADCGLGEVCTSGNHCVPQACGTIGDCPPNFVCNTAGPTLGCLRKTCSASSQCDGFCVNGYCYAAAGFCSPPPP